MGWLRGLPIAVVLLLSLGVGSAGATSVAYLDKGGVWVSSLNGKQKRKVSGRTKDGRRWTELAQADNGRILAVRRPRNKMPTINSFTLWGPTGKRIHRGALGSESGWTSYAYPLSLDLTADGRSVVYGYSVMRYQYPMSQFQQGTYVASAVHVYPVPFTISGQMWPTTVGKRLVTASSNTDFGLQKASSGNPYRYDFNPWISVNLSGFDVERTDVAANGKLAATELDKGDSHKVLMIRIPHLGGAPTSDCLLPSSGAARNVSISQDGRSVAWEDRRGVVVSGAPTFGGTATCRLKRRPVVISRTGFFPSIGAAKIR